MFFFYTVDYIELHLITLIFFFSLTFQQVKCAVCKSIFCCTECRNRHERNAHNPNDVFAERNRLLCAFCQGYATMEFQSRNDFALIMHLCQTHLPLHCKKCLTVSMLFLYLSFTFSLYESSSFLLFPFFSLLLFDIEQGKKNQLLINFFCIDVLVFFRSNLIRLVIFHRLINALI